MTQRPRAGGQLNIQPRGDTIQGGVQRPHTLKTPLILFLKSPLNYTVNNCHD